ncbi:hypothetical protein ACTHPH_04735 [Paenibacillus pasadenensis]|uniref:hypothetical protein n=1 Tax=Paenibacillus TaxID=44249 RepID=UPI000FD75651|nr:hypothetical protein [Paenibacillus pasadenensis]
MRRAGLVLSLMFIISITAIIVNYFSKDNLTVLESDDGIIAEWNKKPLDGIVTSIAFGNSMFVGVGNGIIVTSTNGVDWRSIVNDSEFNYNEVLNDIRFVENQFIAVGNNVIYRSLDGIEWVKVLEDFKNQRHNVAYGNGVFVSLGHGGVMRSKDGISWDYDESSLYWSPRSDLCFADGKFVAVGPYEASTSKDGVSWETTQFPYMDGGGYLTSIAYGNGKFIAIGGLDDNGAVIWSSLDAIKWDPVLRVKDTFQNGHFFNNNFYFVGNNVIINSSDGVNWSIKNIPKNKFIYDVAYGNGGIIGVGRLDEDIEFKYRDVSLKLNY